MSLTHLHELLDELYETGHYPSFQVCIRHRGEIVLHRATGRYRPLDAQDIWRDVDLETRYPLFSISKSITSVAMHILFERGLIHVDDPVCWHIPEFAQHGKSHITLRHVLTHSAGVPMYTWKLTDDLIRDWDRIIQDLCAAKRLYFPGRITSYHILSGGYLIGEVIQRVTGRSLPDFLRTEILEPLGTNTLDYGISQEHYGITACSERVEPLPRASIMKLMNRSAGIDLVEALAVMNRPAVFESVIPAGNIVGTAEETSRFFQMLLDGGSYDGRRILSPEQVRRATVEQVLTRHDYTLLFTPQRYSLGFILGRKSSELNIFGKHTEQAYGHLGFTRNIAWADPARQLSVAFLTSSKITYPRRETLILRRWQNAINQTFSA